MHPAWSVDLDRTLADFSFMPVSAKHILHKSSDIACHAGSRLKLRRQFSQSLFNLLHAGPFALMQVKRNRINAG
jgi:hypothetical protein